jgi:hypothetical protein
MTLASARGDRRASGGLREQDCPRRSRIVQTMPRSTIAFLGQCHVSGYKGVPAALAFPQVCRRSLEARRPSSVIDVLVEQYQHPSELPRMMTKVLRARPRLVVVEVVGWLAIKGRGAVDLSRLPGGVGSAYERVRHFRHITTLVGSTLPRAAGVICRVQTRALDLADGLLGAMIPRYPRPTIEDYEACLDMALARVRQVDGVRSVVQGPGAPNLALDSRGLASDAIERYRAVAAMARRTAAAHGVLYVDRWDSVGPRFFLPGSIRPDIKGHLVWGHLLAEQLLSAGYV